MSENNFTDVFNDPNLPADGQHIDDDQPEEPREEEVYEPDQDTPPLPTTHEEVLQNLARHPEMVSENFVNVEADRLGIDHDYHYDIMEPKEKI